MKRLLGLDFGLQRIGVATSDAGRLIASPHSHFIHRGWGPSAKIVASLLQELDAEFVVLGLPLDSEGREGAQAREVQGFAQALRERGIQVALQDERFSTHQAEEALREAGHSWQRSKSLVDAVSAALILQEYLDAQAQTNIVSQGAGRPFHTGGSTTMAQDKNQEGLNEELESNIVELTDEDGQTTEFEYLTTIEHKGESYVVLLAPQEEENEEEGEVLILRIQQDENGEDTYVSCDNEEIEQEVFELFMEELDEEEDAEFFEEQENN